MEFRIADTFTGSLAKLTGDEQKAVKTTAFDLQVDAANPSMSFHRLDKPKDKNFWSVRVNADIRIIVHRTQGSLLLCFVAHHDKAYDWAERRKLETHPKTGAAQLVEVRETVKEIIVPKYVEVTQPAKSKPLLFGDISDDLLLTYGVPAEWLKDVRQVNEDSLLALTDHLPSEAAEALLELATGGNPRVTEVPEPAHLYSPRISYSRTKTRPSMDLTAEEALPLESPLLRNPFDHPDAQRRFRIMTNAEELQRALDCPWDKWTIFLHPEQQQLVERNYNGPARVSGSAGTGKTIVALHRAVFLARTHTDSRVLLTTFSEILANALRTRLKRLVSNDPRLAERLEIHSIDDIGVRLYTRHFGQPKIVGRKQLLALLQEEVAKVPNNKFTLQFLITEWEQVVDAWQLASWEAYRDVKRLGRKTRLPEPQRAILWSIFDRVRQQLLTDDLITSSGLFAKLATAVAASKQPPFEFAVVDEAQDISVARMRFLAALSGNRPNGLFLAGDSGQRIFQQAFSWRSLGIDIRGRSWTLHVNYRTSHQIRSQADRLLGPEVSDVDGNVEGRRHTISVFNGPSPTIKVLNHIDAETETVSKWISERVREGFAPHEIGIFVRSNAQIGRALAALNAAGLSFKILDDKVDASGGQVAVSSMHLAKGLEFRAVVVMACDDEIIPLQERIETVMDDSDLEEVYNTERQLLYVACTRARDLLLITSVEPASEFLEDLQV